MGHVALAGYCSAHPVQSRYDEVQTVRVCIQGTFSDWIPVIRPNGSVPQDSVLGLILFHIFINDMDKDLDSHILKFADDTEVFCGLSEVRDCEILQKVWHHYRNSQKSG